MSVSILSKTAFGDKRVHIISFVAEAAETNIDTGLEYVEAYSVGVKSAATFAYYMFNNKDSSNVASNGYIGVSGLAAGDDFFITCYGR